MFVVFDIETTGLSEINNDVIEFAYTLFDKNNCFVRSECLYFYYEGMSWSEEAYAVHKIPLEFLKQHKDKFHENLIKMYTVLKNANVVGHNAKHFDCPFCATWLYRMGLEKISYGIINDTMLAFKPVTKKARIKLSALAALRGVTDANVSTMMDYWFPGLSVKRAHDAAYDVTTTALLTLDALRNNYMTFEPLKLSTVETVDDRFAETKASIPDIYFKTVKGESLGICFKPYTSKTVNISEDNVRELVEEGRYLYCEAVTLVDRYCFYYNNTDFQIKFSNSGDTLTVINSAVEYTFTEYTPMLQTILKNTFGGNNFV